MLTTYISKTTKVKTVRHFRKLSQCKSEDIETQELRSHGTCQKKFFFSQIKLWL